jgi:hypothetical protein
MTLRLLKSSSIFCMHATKGGGSVKQLKRNSESVLHASSEKSALPIKRPGKCCMLFNCNACYDVAPDKMVILQNERTPDISNRSLYFEMIVHLIQKFCLNISYFVMTYSIIRYIYFNIDLFILLFT